MNTLRTLAILITAFPFTASRHCFATTSTN